jgi:AraC-like DNA-binding protein
MPFKRCFAASEFRFVHYATRSPNPPHAHGDYVLTYIFRGSSRSRIGPSSIIHFHPGEINLLNPGEWHRDFASTQEREGLTVGVKNDFFESLQNDIGRGERKAVCFPFPKIEVGPDIRSIWESMRAEVDGDQIGREILLRSMATELMIHLLRRMTSFALQPDVIRIDTISARWQVRRAIEFLRDNFREKFDLERIAQAAGLSKYYLERVFKRSTGLQLHTYMMMLRIDRARQLLRYTRKPIADIALDLGFSDQSHFTNSFKRLTGASPRSFQQARSHRVPEGEETWLAKCN